MSSTFNILITGANRGLGFELSKQLSESTTVGKTHIYSATRNPANAAELNKLAQARGNIEVVELDVASEESIAKAAKHFADKNIKLNLIINNAGIIGEQDRDSKIFNIIPEDWLNVYRVNVLGPALVMKHFIPLVKDFSADYPAHIASISSTLASIALTDNPMLAVAFGYSASKSALNQVVKGAAFEYPNIIFSALCPGWVKTDMGGENASLTPEESIGNVVKVILGFKKEQTGSFVNHLGEVIPY